MKSLFLMIVLTASNLALADVSHYTASNYQPRSALLVLPTQNSNETDSDTIEDSKRNLTRLNDDIMEKLRQQIGSDTGVYYVYLPDGRLQRVQYTTAPIEQQDNRNEQQQSANGNYQKSNQYTQNSASNNPQSNQQSNHQIVIGTNKQTTQGNQQQFSKYLVAQQQPSIVLPIVELPLPKTQTGSNGNQEHVSSQYYDERTQNGAASSNGYLASVQFTDVPPINGPIFAYNQSPLVRIVRYAD